MPHTGTVLFFDDERLATLTRLLKYFFEGKGGKV